MREEACKIVSSPQNNQSYVLVLPATLEFQPRMTDVKGLNLAGAESGNGRTRKESWCNLVLPQSNESDVLVLVTLKSVLDALLRATRGFKRTPALQVNCCKFQYHLLQHHECVVGLSIMTSQRIQVVLQN